MSTRHLVVAALLVCAGAAQADVVSTTGFQNGWTAGNGTSVIGSGVLGSDVSLVGGVAHGSTGNLIGKASASLSSADAQKLFVQQGIDAAYVLSAGNGLLAARYGNSVSVINDGDGVKIVPGQNAGGGSAAPGAPAAGAPAAGGGGGGGGGGGAPVGGGSPAPGGGSTAPGGNSGSPSTPGSGSDSGGGNVTLPTPGADPVFTLPVQDQIGALPDEVNAVPEPGTIALMLAGLVGAGAFSRRRNAKQ
ncbi:PEP-CTERM sorting domain-containing protein [Massilia sp. CFBP9012]|uniref:PEP-CTERM sorting domain-containing protein n=1 Tax=Massilia sp. CFBP9012 TaxID=3096531 RepID=UPI002A6A041A|nr:PEP-CTERM sorting domain-containing protein [Massilia sp. CFBP9012]MDY0975041.1 PEP-CTERM sorting domain-containing protein [Massilia sp. CFBP9012]